MNSDVCILLTSNISIIIIKQKRVKVTLRQQAVARHCTKL